MEKAQDSILVRGRDVVGVFFIGAALDYFCKGMFIRVANFAANFAAKKITAGVRLSSRL